MAPSGKPPESGATLGIDPDPGAPVLTRGEDRSSNRTAAPLLLLPPPMCPRGDQNTSVTLVRILGLKSWDGQIGHLWSHSSLAGIAMRWSQITIDRAWPHRRLQTAHCDSITMSPPTQLGNGVHKSVAHNPRSFWTTTTYETCTKSHRRYPASAWFQILPQGAIDQSPRWRR